MKDSDNQQHEHSQPTKKSLMNPTTEPETLEEIRARVGDAKSALERYNLIAKASQLLSTSGNKAAHQISPAGPILCSQSSFIKDLCPLGVAGVTGGGINVAQGKIISGFDENTQERLIRHIVGNRLNQREVAAFLEKEVADPTNVKRVAQKSRQPWKTVTLDTELVEELKRLYQNGPDPTPKNEETQASGTGETLTRREVIQKLRESTLDVHEDGMMDPDVFREVFGSRIGENDDDGDIERALRFAYGSPQAQRNNGGKKEEKKEVDPIHHNGNGKNGTSEVTTPEVTTSTDVVVCDPSTTITGKALCKVLSSIATLAGLLGKVRPSDLREVLHHPEFEPQLSAHLNMAYKNLAEFEAIAGVFGWKIQT